VDDRKHFYDASQVVAEVVGPVLDFAVGNAFQRFLRPVVLEVDGGAVDE